MSRIKVTEDKEYIVYINLLIPLIHQASRDRQFNNQTISLKKDLTRF